MTPSSGSINLLAHLIEFTETLTFASLLRDIIRDTEEQPVKEIHKARSGKVPSVGGSIPMKLGCITNTTPPHVDVIPHLEILQTPYFWNFMEASTHSLIDH